MRKITVSRKNIGGRSYGIQNTGDPAKASVPPVPLALISARVLKTSVTGEKRDFYIFLRGSRHLFVEVKEAAG